jgi:hypothetical protein
MAGVRHIAVPAYFGLNPDWAQIEQAAGAVKIVVPDLSFNQLTGSALSNAQAQFDRCRQAGQLILGYVDTGSGQRSLANINNDINQWFASYPTQLDGVFFDDGPELDLGTDQAFQAFYIPLIQAFKGAHVGHNTVLLNAAGFPNEWVMQAADYVILWEQTETFYLTNFNAIGPGGSVLNPPAWWANPLYMDRIVHIIYSSPSSDLPNMINRSRSLNAGLVYIFDGTSTNYGQLPAYWQQEVMMVSGTPIAVAGDPGFIQGRFGIKGNFEMVVPLTGGGLAHFWRDNDSAGLPWRGGVQFGASTTYVSVSLIQSNFSSSGNGPGNLEVIARFGNQLDFYWRDDAPPFAWHGPLLVTDP